jgi:plasmid stabilization system protein ParE
VRQFVVRPLAEADVQAAFDWYEEQAVGLGHEFLRAVDACYATIERTPELYPVVYKRLRRALMRRFPYAVYYVLTAESILIAACTHGRQHPRRWRSRA